MSRSLLLTVLVLALLCFVSGQNDAKTNKLVKLSKRNGVVKMDSNAYFQYTQGTHKYSMVVLITARGDQFQCALCRQFDPEYKLVASSFKKSKHPDQVFFGHLDFEDGQAVYQQLALQSAPTVFYFPPSDSSNKNGPIKYDLSRNGLTAESFAEFIKHQSGISFKVTRPFDYGQFIVKVILCLGVVATIKLVYRHFSFILFHKNTWAAIIIVIVLVMTSGHMFNRIRNTPDVIRGPSGQVSYVASGFSFQCRIETQLVAAIYGVLALAVVYLATRIPTLDDKWQQRARVYLWTCFFLVIFSFLLALFKIKYGAAYPLKILF